MNYTVYLNQLQMRSFAHLHEARTFVLRAIRGKKYSARLKHIDDIVNIIYNLHNTDDYWVIEYRETHSEDEINSCDAKRQPVTNEFMEAAEIEASTPIAIGIPSTYCDEQAIFLDYKYVESMTMRGILWKVYSRTIYSAAALLDPDTYECVRPMHSYKVYERIGVSGDDLIAIKLPNLIAKNQDIMSQRADNDTVCYTIRT